MRRFIWLALAAIGLYVVFVQVRKGTDGESLRRANSEVMKEVPAEILLQRAAEEARKKAEVQKRLDEQARRQGDGPVPMLPGAENGWIGMGSVPGLGGRLSSIAFHGNTIYVAGIFSSQETNLKPNDAYGEGLSTVAAWTGNEWRPLARYGNCGDVNALAVASNGDLYAGGAFCINGTRVNNIGKWDGKSWQPVGQGVEGNVIALHIDKKGVLYATGGGAVWT